MKHRHDIISIQQHQCSILKHCTTAHNIFYQRVYVFHQRQCSLANRLLFFFFFFCRFPRFIVVYRILSSKPQRCSHTMALCVGPHSHNMSNVVCMGLVCIDFHIWSKIQTDCVRVSFGSQQTEHCSHSRSTSLRIHTNTHALILTHYTYRMLLLLLCVYRYAKFVKADVSTKWQTKWNTENQKKKTIYVHDHQIQHTLRFECLFIIIIIVSICTVVRFWCCY